MNHYATEQLMRQRLDQFAQEAHGDNVVRLARNNLPSSQPVVGPSPLRSVVRFMWGIGTAIFTKIAHFVGLLAALPAAARSMRQRHDGEKSPIGG